MVTRIIPVESFDMIIFGASGDLAQRKILPGLYHRLVAGQLPPTARIIGAARSDWSREEFQQKAAESYAKFVPEHEQNTEMLAAFLNCLHYVAIDAMGDGGWDKLAALVKENPNPVRAFYLSVAPSLFGPIASRLLKADISTPESRIVVEKPFGHDLATAIQVASCVAIREAHQEQVLAGAICRSNSTVWRTAS